jgi:hypothetical protein
MKIKFYFVLLLIFAGIAFYSCSSSNTAGSGPQTGDYTSTFSDSVGNKLIDGIFTIETADGGKITGSFKKSNTYDSTFSGYGLLRGGKFTGTYKQNGDIGFNMNPMLADNNVYIGAKLSGDNIAGNWAQSTMTGTKSKGKFSAALK